MSAPMNKIIALTTAAMIATGPIAWPSAAITQDYAGRQTVAAGSGTRLINLPRGTSFAVDLPADARDVIVSNPAVAEANVHSPRRITVIGIAPGETDAVFLDAAGRSILTLRVRVDAGVSALQDTLSRVAPGAQVRAEAINDSIVLTGLVTSVAQSEQVAQVARAFVSAPEKVLNMVTIAGSDQVTLKVRVVEVQRNVIKQLGLSTDAVFSTGYQSFDFGRTNTYGVNGQALGGSGACYNRDRARTEDFTRTRTSGNETTSGTNASNTSTNDNSTTAETNASNTNRSSTQTNAETNARNTVTGTTTNDQGTTLTTSDGRTLTFLGTAPGSVTVTDFAGNTSTLTGETAADYLRENLSTTNASTSVVDVIEALTGTTSSTISASLVEALLGTTSGSVVSSVINAVTGSNSGSSLINGVENVVSSAYQTVTGTNASACLQAFERVGLIRTLAEPNLTSVNGESASFLAGGEFPVPTGRDRDGNVTIEFKPYGVSLGFRPIVLSEGRISLQISAEVSELTQTGGITLGAGTTTALNIAGLNVRRVQNTVEIPSGGSMMIAGLLQESTRQTVDSYPGLGGLPVLGSLFRSRDYLSGETELVVIVEPYIVTPTSPGRMQTPADGLRIATDAQTIFFGQLNQAYGSPTPTDTASAGWQGPVGYVIE